MTKKELREQYKQRKPEMGVYKIVDTKNNQTYLGKSKDFKATRNSLFFRLSVGALANYPELQKDYNEVGESCIQFEILEKLDQIEGLDNYKEELDALLQITLSDHEEAKEMLP